MYMSRGTCPNITTCALAHPGLRDSAIVKYKKPSVRNGDDEIVRLCIIYSITPHST